MGFLSRLRLGVTHGGDADSVHAHDASRASEPVAGEGTAGLSAAQSRVSGLRARMMSPMGRPQPVEGTTSAERTFMDLRRGSND